MRWSCLLIVGAVWTAGCVVQESTPASKPFRCDEDGTVPRARDGGFVCVAPDALPLSAQQAQSAVLAADAGTAGDAGTADHAVSATGFSSSGQLHLGASSDAGEALVVAGGFHVQGFPVIGRVGTYALDASVSTSAAGGPIVLNVPLDGVAGGSYRYRVSATLESDLTFPDYALCELLVQGSQGQTATQDRYPFATSQEHPANVYLEGRIPGDATQLLIYLDRRDQSGGGFDATCTLESLTGTLEVFQ